MLALLNASNFLLLDPHRRTYIPTTPFSPTAGVIAKHGHAHNSTIRHGRARARACAGTVLIAAALAADTAIELPGIPETCLGERIDRRMAAVCDTPLAERMI
ncbi:hypothetical protein GMOD_00006244 [Pyrenophora seminiperda CCB06]|uniref:Uncharacterized protein n=1 Tax=Pyrenophora seminiperda CCB06 TaxID=1302712 RepID=A0A3M7M4J3_9PLEO|nr:hypothetical protein GMOD_00006244 [Pyrenophora seminiperda CCB06]